MEQDINFTEFEKNKKRRITLIHKVYLSQLKTNRKYTASTKTKSEVRGGGRKPWRQKGTGQARAGSTRSPLWVGGGVSFGPKPKSVNKKINRKEKKIAILSAFYLKEKKTKVFDSNLLENSTSFSQTKKVHDFLKSLKISEKEKTLIIVPQITPELWRNVRNIQNITLSLANCLSVAQLLNSHNILLSTESVALINQTYGKRSRSKTN